MSMKNVLPYEVFERYRGSEGSRGYVYHGTSIENLEGILQHGLVPGKARQYRGEDPDQKVAIGNGVYVTSDLRWALSFAEIGTGRPGLLVICSVQTRSLALDEDALPGVLNEIVDPEDDQLGGDRGYSLVLTRLLASLERPNILGLSEYFRSILDAYTDRALEALSVLMPSGMHRKQKSRMYDLLREYFGVLVRYQFYRKNLERRGVGIVDQDREWYLDRVSEDEWDDLRQVFMGNRLGEDRALSYDQVYAVRTKFTVSLRALVGQSGTNSGYSRNPIGWQGSNRIVALLQITRKSTVLEIKVIRGNVPREFHDALGVAMPKFTPEFVK